MADNSVPVYAILLAGGVGTRLWPISRERHPKQIAKFIGNDSLIQTTVKRLMPAMPADAIKIVCGSEHFDDIARNLSEIGISPDRKNHCRTMRTQHGSSHTIGRFINNESGKRCHCMCLSGRPCNQ